MEVNTTSQSGQGQEILSAQMKTYYDKELIRNAKPRLVHDQFAQKKPIPPNRGKTVEFRKLSPFAPATEPLQEGVTPAGKKLDWSTLSATVSQYGDYVSVSDMLEMTAIDHNLLEAQEILGDQAGRTLDTVTREIISAGTNVMFANKKLARHTLTGGDGQEGDFLRVEDIKRAATCLKNNLATPIGGSYVAIIHPNVAHDLTADPLWEAVKSYDPKDLYDGEIGRLFGVRFIETSEAKVFRAQPFGAFGTLHVAGASGTALTVKEAVEGQDLEGRMLHIDGQVYTVTAQAGKVLTLDESCAAAADAVIYDGGAGAAGADVYATLVFGQNAYGVTEIEGGGLQTIIKQLGSAGSSDPLDQRATVGWKATRTAAILSEPFMVRLESCSSAVGEGGML